MMCFNSNPNEAICFWFFEILYSYINGNAGSKFCRVAKQK